jgi:hypothetical protein
MGEAFPEADDTKQFYWTAAGGASFVSKDLRQLASFQFSNVIQLRSQDHVGGISQTNVG